jgi:hypothetical protein
MANAPRIRDGVTRGAMVGTGPIIRPPQPRPAPQQQTAAPPPVTPPQPMPQATASFGGAPPPLQQQQQQRAPLQMFLESMTSPQAAASDPGVREGLEPQASTLFNFGGPASANPNLGDVSPAMANLMQLFRRKPIY